MENYEDFIRIQLSRLDVKGGEQKRSRCSVSSVIRFHGVPILPPLLSAESREEMLRYRSDAQCLVDRRSKSELGQRMLHLQELLDSVQLRKAPTLREFMGDEPLAADWETGGGAYEIGGVINDGAELEMGDHDDRPLHTPAERRGNPPCPLTSTVRGNVPEFSNLAAEGDISMWGDVDPFRKESKLRTCGDVSHRSASSGYATHDNTEVTAGLTEVTQGHGEVMAGHAEVTLVHTTVAAGDLGVMVGHLEKGKGEGGEDVVEEGEKEGEDEEKGVEEGEGRVQAAPESFFLHCAVGASQKVPDVVSEASPGGGAGVCDGARALGEPAGGGDRGAELSEGPCRMSLQALLKRSQEYRQRQRQLRGARTRLSDKENQPDRGPLHLRRARRDRRTGPARVQPASSGTVRLDRPARTPPAAADRDQGGAGPGGRLEPGEGVLGTRETKTCQEEGSSATAFDCEVPPAGRGEERGGPAQPKPADPPDKPVQAENVPPALKATPTGMNATLTTLKATPAGLKATPTTLKVSPIGLKAPPTRVKAPPTGLSDRFGAIPSLQFCTSPIRSKRTGRPARKLPVNTALSAGGGHRGPQSGASEAGPDGGGSELAQLEMNLSSLKTLIADLQATLTDTTAQEKEAPASQHAERFEWSERTRLSRPVPSLAQRRLVPDLFRKVPGVARTESPVLSNTNQHPVLSDTCQHPILSDTSQHPVLSDTSQHPVLSDTSQHPVLSDTTQHPVLSDTTEHPVLSDTTQHPVLSDTTQHPVLSDTTQHPILSDTSQNPVLSDTSQHPVLSDTSQNPVLSDTSQHPVLSDTTQHPVLSDTTQHPVLSEIRNQSPMLSDTSTKHPACGLSANRSYDVEKPSALWPLGGPDEARGRNQLTPEARGGHGQDSRAKRRLLMNTTSQGGHRPLSSTPKDWVSVLRSQQLQLKQAHATQLRALRQEQQLQLQEILQRLSLQGVSVLGPSPSSDGRDMVTRFPLEPFPLQKPLEPCPLLHAHTLLKPCGSSWRPLVAAVVKGFLTRRLLRTERLAQLQRTVKDSLQLLQALHTQTPSRGDLGGRQDLLLQERVLLQLRSARYEIHDVFFCLSPAERVEIISWDRQLLRDRQLKRQESGWTQSRGRSSLSAATVKALERRSVGCQKRAAERQKRPVGGACGGQVHRHAHSELRPTLSSRNR